MLWWLLGVIALVLIGALVWYWAQQQSGIRRETPPLQTIIPLPPPPEPPPEQEPPPEPEEVEQDVPDPDPEPTPLDEPLPEDDVPRPSDDLSEAMQIDGDAQSGSDAFGLSAGGGGGMGGSGAGRAGNATYGQYLAYQLQRVLRDDADTRALVFQLRLNLWLNEGGQITRVEVLRSSGDDSVDEKVVTALRRAAAFGERPPASLRLPVTIAVSGRRPG